MLIFLTAGDKDLFEQCGPAFNVMGKASFFLGEVGQGAAMKLVVNMVMGSMMASFSEGLLLGEKAGLEPSTILEVISQGAISCPMFGLKGPAMIHARFAPAFPLKHQHKDLRLALQLGDEVGQRLPVAQSATMVFEDAENHGWGDEDFSGVIRALHGQQRV